MATITSNATGNSNTGGTWVGGVVPGSGDDVVIAGHVITLDADHTWNSLTLNNTASRIMPSGAARNLNITTFWRHSAVVAASACTIPASCTFTVNLGMFDHTTNQSQYVFALAAACQLNLNSNNVTPAAGNLLDPVGVSTTLLVTMTNASAVCVVNGYFDAASGQLTLFNMTAGSLTVNNDVPHNPGLTATSKILSISGSGVVTAALNGDCNSSVAQSTTGLVTVANANATVTITGTWYQGVTNTAGALLHISAGVLILDGKACHIQGTNTLTIWVAGGSFRWENQTVTIDAAETLTIYCTAGLLDFDDLLIENYNKVVGLMTGTSTYSSSGAVITNYPGASGAINFMDVVTVNTEDPAPTLPAAGVVAAGQIYGYTGSPLTGTGLIVDPSILASAVGASLDNISTTALARFISVDTGQTSATAGAVASFGGASASAIRTEMDNNSTKLASIDSAVAAGNALVETANESLAELTGIAQGIDTGVDSLLNKSESRLPKITIQVVDGHADGFDALFDVRGITGNWDCSDFGTLFSDTGGTNQASDGVEVKNWKDRVSGMPAVLEGTNGMILNASNRGILFGGNAAAHRLKITTDAGLDLMRNKPIVYVVAVVNPAVAPGHSQTFAFMSTGASSSNSRLWSYTNNSGRLNMESRRQNSDANLAIFTGTAQYSGSPIIAAYQALYTSGSASVAKDDDTAATGTYATSGNSEDTRAQIFSIGGSGGVSPANVLNGRYHELIIATPTTVWTAGEWAALFAGLRAKWGIAA